MYWQSSEDGVPVLRPVGSAERRPSPAESTATLVGEEVAGLPDITVGESEERLEQGGQRWPGRAGGLDKCSVSPRPLALRRARDRDLATSSLR